MKMRNQINLAVLAALLSTSVFAGTFSDNFSTGLNPAYWNISQTTAGLYTVNATGGNVNLALPNPAINPGGFQNVEVDLNLAALGGNISGDFSVQINFTNAIIGPNNDQVALTTQFADGTGFDDTYDLSSGLNVHVWNGGIQGATGVSATFGTFTVRRTGSLLTGYYNGTAIFTETESSALNAVWFSLQNQPGASGDSPSVTFGNFSITGTIANDCLSPPSGLVSWWPGDGNANDIVGGNNGNLGTVTFVPGEVGQAFHFDGSSWITTTNEANLSFDRTNAFSIDAWIRTTNTSGNEFIVAKRQLVAPFNGYGLIIDNGQLPKCYTTDPTPPGAGWLQFFLDGSDTADCPRDHALVVYGTTSVNDGLWHHVAATYDGSGTAAGAVLYVDGVVQTNLVIADNLGTNSIATSEGFTIGAGSGNGPAPFVGDIDEIDVFNRVISQADILAIVNAGIEGKCKLWISNPQLSGTNFTFNFQTVSNQSYTVQQNSDLATTNWQFFETITGDGSFDVILVPMTNAQMFFRLKQP